MGESTARFCACRGPPRNAATGPNGTISLYDTEIRFFFGLASTAIAAAFARRPI
jgi:hypothetical protein